MGCVSSKIHVEKETPSAPRGRYANFKRWIGRKRRAMVKNSVTLTKVEPFKAPSSPSLSSRSRDLLDNVDGGNKTPAFQTGNTRCATRLICRGRRPEAAPVDDEDHSDGEEASGFWRSDDMTLKLSGDSLTCERDSSVNSRRQRGPAASNRCRHRDDNIQLLRDIMTLEGNAISREEAEDMLDKIKSKVEGLRRERAEEETREAEDHDINWDGILQVEPLHPTTPAPTQNGRSRYQQMTEVCRAILQEENAEEDEEDAQDDEQWEEEVIEIDESCQVSEEEEEKKEEEEEAGSKPKYANSTEELEATINQIFKRWNLSMPDNLASISETIRCTVSRAASTRPETAGFTVVTPPTNQQPPSSPTTSATVAGPVNRTSRERPARPNAARLPRTPADAGIGPQTPGSLRF